VAPIGVAIAQDLPSPGGCAARGGRMGTHDVAPGLEVRGVPIGASSVGATAVRSLEPSWTVHGETRCRRPTAWPRLVPTSGSAW
jgi:hypothetical protein